MSVDRVISSSSLVLTIAAAIVAMTAVQRVEEMRDAMQDRELRMAAAPAEMPPVEEEEPAFTFGDRMNSFARRFAGLWFAARSGNTDLAKYELDEMHEVIEGIESLNKIENGVNINGVLGALEHTQLKALGEAIESGDLIAFDRAYRDTVKTCNACHSSSARPFIQIKIPEHPPVVNRSYEPVVEQPHAVKVSNPD